MVKVGSMRRAKRILVITGILLVGTTAADAGLFGRKAKKTPDAPVTTNVMALTAIEVDGSQVILRTNGAPAYTSYSPTPGVFVVDLTGASKDVAATIPATLPPAVVSMSAEEVVEMGNALTRVTFRLTQQLGLEVSAIDKAVVVTIPSTSAPVETAPAIVEALPVVAPVVNDPPAPEPVQTASVEPVSEPVVEAPAPAPAPAVVAEPESLPRARNVRRIDAATNGDAVEVRVSADGALKYKAFRLENPTRLVIDLEGVKNSVPKSTVNVGDELVQRVRVAQFSAAPPVARVVIDLNRKSEYTIDASGDQLRVAFGGVVRAASLPPVTPESRPEARTTPAPAPTPADIPSQVPTIAENVAPAPAKPWKMPEPASKGARSVINAPPPQEAPPPPTPRENVFDDAVPPTTTARTLSGSRTLSGGPRTFTGEPISLNLKDADVKDVLRTFAELTGLNMAIDPGVGGSVTVDFVDVPWDQALDIILRQNGLTFVLEGNVMRIGTIDRIAAETQASRRLQEEERLNVPLTTLSFKLSYARAADVSSLLRDIASPRARIIVDNRTNQLIISEIPQYLTLMQNLITTVDIATRQVTIEARIVESSRTFSQSYGFTWNFDGELDPALGTGTGLVFPNRVGFVGGPFNFGGPGPILSFELFDVLGAFNLDFALHAAEAQGYAKIISAPRVTTQDNQSADITSGFQIPYQTRINFTTTVQYLDATLRLSVIPQITEAGTVIMDIQVQKNEPLVGLTIEGAAGTPLTTRQARTRLMVRDGGTAVIAGIFQTKDNDAVTRVPFVHQIPIIGNLFKSHNVVTSHDELLIFITPRIVRG